MKLIKGVKYICRAPEEEDEESPQPEQPGGRY